MRGEEGPPAAVVSSEDMGELPYPVCLMPVSEAVSPEVLSWTRAWMFCYGLNSLPPTTNGVRLIAGMIVQIAPLLPGLLD